MLTQDFRQFTLHLFDSHKTVWGNLENVRLDGCMTSIPHYIV
jgi:hypothetical protein